MAHWIPGSILPAACRGIVPLALMAMFLMQALPSEGAPGRMEVRSEADFLHYEGGGYINWKLTGAATSELRKRIDSPSGGYGGNGNGIVDAQPEAVSFTEDIENSFENTRFKHARIYRTDSTASGITGTDVNSTAPIEMDITYRANMGGEGAFPLAGVELLSARLATLLNDPSSVEWEESYREITLGLGSFAGGKMEKGSGLRLRTPAGEIFLYSVSYTGKPPDDTAEYQRFSLAQSPVQLFFLVVIGAYFTVWLPRRVLDAGGRKRWRPLHYLAWGLVAVYLPTFFFGTDGVALWIMVPLGTVGMYLLARKVYLRGWKGLAVPLVRRPAGPPPAGASTPEDTPEDDDG